MHDVIRPGYLSARVLNLLRMSEISVLNLTPSLLDQSGLNLDALDLLQGTREIFVLSSLFF
jgi:hypothetical protein